MSKADHVQRCRKRTQDAGRQSRARHINLSSFLLPLLVATAGPCRGGGEGGGQGVSESRELSLPHESERVRCQVSQAE